MAKQKFIPTYLQNTSPWAKSVVSVIVIGGLAYVGYQIYQSIKDAKDKKDANKPAEAAAQELEKLAAQGVYPTYSDTQFLGLVEQLVQAMTGCGTDEQSVYRVFGSLYNDADFLKLTQLFGVRYYQPCAWTSPIAYAIWQANDKAYGGNLPTWLGYDLGSSEIANINSILQGKGIHYSY